MNRVLTENRANQLVQTLEKDGWNNGYWTINIEVSSFATVNRQADVITITINTTPPGVFAALLVSWGVVTTGHKYAAFTDISSTGTGNWFGRTFITGVPQWSNTGSYIVEGLRSDGTLFQFTLRSGGNHVGDVITIRKPMLIDLTLMYGAGNEPSTVEQFLTDYPEYNDYVPYPGVLKNYKVLETCGQVDLGSLNWTIGSYNYLQASMEGKNCKVFATGSFPIVEIPGYTPARVYGGDIGEDLQFTITGTGPNQYLKIRDDYWYNFQTPETFKQHLQGVVARYELANPATYLITEVSHA